MIPTNEDLQKYIGGQIEIQNQMEEYIYRGEIKNISIDEKNLTVDLEWCAKGVGYPPLPESWEKDDTHNYKASTMIYGFNDIGDDRISVSSRFTGERVTLFPKGGSKLDPKKVKGLMIESV